MKFGDQFAMGVGWLVIYMGTFCAVVAIAVCVFGYVYGRTENWRELYKWMKAYRKYHGATPWENEP